MAEEKLAFVTNSQQKLHFTEVWASQEHLKAALGLLGSSPCPRDSRKLLTAFLHAQKGPSKRPLMFPA